MSVKSFISPDLQSYIDRYGYQELPLLAKLREETANMPNSRMQISPDQGHLFQLLIKATGARRALEIGVFTGYSSMAVALALPEGGHLTALDISEEYTSVARRYWKEALVDNKIDLRIAPALDSLDALLAEGKAETYDFAFIDADKTSYQLYLDRTLTLMRKGGLITIDNTLRDGRVTDPNDTEPDNVAMRAFNEKLHSDPRVLACLLPIADGFTMAVKL